MSVPPSVDGILVLGMHRSGTSATAGALARLGFDLGAHLVPAAPDNPKGYFENADVVGLNDRLLAALGRSWDDVRALPCADAGDARFATLIAEMRDRVVPQMTSRRPWATKDPRMSRLLPLWRPVLETAGVRPACLLVLRHPDEVAASLAARDRMPARQAHLLWLRHVMDAVQGSEGLARCVVAYDALLADPAGVLGAALDALGIAMPERDPVAALGSFVDASERHHDAALDGGERDPWSAFALQVYRALVAAPDPWSAARELDREFARRVDADAAWIDLLGQVTGAAHSAHDRLRHAWLDAQRRVDERDRALATAEALCVERLDAIEASERRLHDAETALSEAQALVERYAVEAATLGAALEKTQALAASQLDAGKRQLAQTERALAEAEGLARDRLQEVRAAEDRVRTAEAALAEATRLCEEGLATSRQLDRELADTARALADAEALARDRLGLLRELDERVRATDVALAEATGLCNERLVALERLDEQARSLDAARADAETRAAERLEALEAQRDELARAHRQLDHAEARIDSTQRRLELADAELARIRRSPFWAVYTRFRRSGDESA